MGNFDRQQSLPFPSRRGGLRRGAGRRLAPGRRPGVPHRRRPGHASRYPAHVTLRASVHCLRSPRVFPEARRAIGAASRAEFCVAHFSVQNDHVHLIVEAEDRDAPSRGIWGLAIRLTRAVNRVLERRGSIWDDRYHARPLRTPREVRSALVYVVQNFRNTSAGRPASTRARRHDGSTVFATGKSLRAKWRTSSAHTPGFCEWVGDDTALSRWLSDLQRKKVP